MKNKKYNLSTLMTRAHKIRKELSVSISEALKLAWKFAKVLKDLDNYVCSFKFIKQNGQIREAAGISMKQANFKAKGTGSKKDIPTLVTYYDTRSEGVRSFHIQNFISFS